MKAIQSFEELMPVTAGPLVAVKRLFSAGHPVCVAFSGGKDSSAVAVLALEAALRAKAEGLQPKLYFVSSDTLVENPEIAQHMRAEHRRIWAFAHAKGLDVEAHVASPSLLESFAVRVLSGRALPSFPGQSSDCSTSWKVNPMNALRRRLQKGRGFDRAMVTLTGTRFSESIARGAKMAERGDEAESPVARPSGELVMCPIAHWHSDDVWELLGNAASGFLDSYSDQSDVMRIYAASGGTSCAVVSDSISDLQRPARGCGSRTGCFLCTMVSSDRSMENMVKAPEYRYMAGLNRFRNFLQATQFDWSRRHWIGRTIRDGFIRVGPDTYSSAMVLDLLRYCLTLDAQEREAASAGGSRPRFEIVPLEAVVALDVLWSLHGLHRPFEAVTQWHLVHHRGKRFEVPDLQAVPKTAMPAFRYLPVGVDWDNGARSLYTGLRDPLVELAGELGEGHYCMHNALSARGEDVLDINTARSFTVDAEAVCLALEFEWDRMMELRDGSSAGHGLTKGYMWWTQYGAVSVAKGHVGVHDEILRRTHLKERLGLAGPEINLSRVLAMSLTRAEAYGVGAEAENFSRESQGVTSGPCRSLVFPVPASVLVPAFESALHSEIH